MNKERTFGEWLGRWAGRGTLWAAPSAFYAWVAGYQNVPAISAMLTGIVFWCLIYASVSASPQYGRRWRETRFGKRLRAVIRLKTWLIMFCPLAVFWQWFVVLILPDMYGGFAAIYATKVMGGQAVDFDATLGRVPEFGWTLVTTVIQGAVISLQVLLVTAVACLFPPYRKHKPIVSAEGATSAGG